MKTGRNDPCSCGSGKKYKHCCLVASVAVAEAPEELAWRRIRRANEGLAGKMIQFAVHTYGEPAIDDAWAEFMLWEGEETWKESPHCSAFLPWMLHHWSPDPKETSILDESLYGVPPTRAYLERKGKHLDPTVSRYLEACLAEPFNFHEIIDCVPEHGFRAIDLIAGEEHEVRERSASRTLQKGDVLFASLIRCDGIVLIEGMARVVIPPAQKLPILKFRQKVAARRDLFAQELLREWDIELRALYLEIVKPF